MEKNSHICGFVGNRWFLAHFYYERGGQILYSLAALLPASSMFSFCLMSSDDMEWHTVPKKMIIVLNVGIYWVIIFLLLTLGKAAQKDK